MKIHHHTACGKEFKEPLPILKSSICYNYYLILLSANPSTVFFPKCVEMLILTQAFKSINSEILKLEISVFSLYPWKKARKVKGLIVTK